MEIDETEIPHAQEVGAGDQQINSYDDNYDVSDDYFPKDNKISLKKQQDRYYTLGADFEWLRDNEINITDEFEESSIAINIGDEILLSESNIVTITGKAKSCKTYINSAITAAAVSKEEQLNFTAEEIVQRVLYIDTEQSKPHVHKVTPPSPTSCAVLFESLPLHQKDYGKAECSRASSVFGVVSGEWREYSWFLSHAGDK